MSVARNSHLTDKPQADGALILPPPPPLPPPLSISAPFYRYLQLLKATRTPGKKSKERFEVTPGNRIREPQHRRLHNNQLC